MKNQYISKGRFANHSKPPFLMQKLNFGGNFNYDELNKQ